MSSSERWMVFAGIVFAGFLVWLLQPVLTPFLAAALLAYLGDPLVDRLETFRLPRTGAVLVVFTVLLLVILGIVLLLVPMVGTQIEYLREVLPAMFAWAQDTALPWVEREFEVDLSAHLRLDRIGTELAAHWRQTGDIATLILQRVSSSGLALIGWVATAALIPVVTFYLLRDWDTLVARVRDLLPRRIEPVASGLTRECDEVLGAFLRGQLLVMLSLGVIYAIGLWALGLDLALLIGMVAGVASIVPYLGTIVGIGAALVAAVFQFGDVWHLVGVAIVFGVGQMLEGMVLTPLLVGDRIGMHPVAVIFAVLAGGQLFGFVGVLLALPVAAVIMVLLRHVHDLYKGSELYGTDGSGAEG
ncbi:AI-2E family transporter [Halofilum ochraceum]|uniref:AI-2E family transporter n=1 Tax=Halofilum ochraceum TaxID=1611323 RepID=UPI0008DA76AE|nr:AI-2E family transporter [Halofilum ochraceum]